MAVGSEQRGPERGVRSAEQVWCVVGFWAKVVSREACRWREEERHHEQRRRPAKNRAADVEQMGLLQMR